MRKKTVVTDQTIEDHKGIGIHVNNPDSDVEVTGGTMRRGEGIGIMIGEGPSIPDLLNAIEARLGELDAESRARTAQAIAETRTATTKDKMLAGLAQVAKWSGTLATGALGSFIAQKLSGQ